MKLVKNVTVFTKSFLAASSTLIASDVLAWNVVCCCYSCDRKDKIHSLQEEVIFFYLFIFFLVIKQIHFGEADNL